MKTLNNQFKTISIKNQSIFKNMKHIIITAMVAIITLTSNNIYAHNGNGDGDDHPDVKLNVNPALTICGFQASSALTQSEFNQFGKEIGYIGFATKKWTLS